MRWVSSEKAFKEVDSDILEQKHINNIRKESTDYEMYIPCDIKPSDLAIYKIVKTELSQDSPNNK